MASFFFISKSKKILSLLLIVVTFLAYSNVFHLEFVNFDDDRYVLENNRVKSGLGWESILWSFSFNESNWHPLTWLSHMLDIELFGLDPLGHHAMNLLIHVFNVVLFFWILQGITRAPRRSFLVAGLFAIHPLHVESVAWVSERKDVLCAFFWLLTMAAYHGYSKSPSLIRGSVVVLCFILGLMSKPMIVTLPFLLLLLDIWPLKRLGDESLSEIIRSRLFRRHVLEKIPLMALAFVVIAATILAQTEALNKMELRYRLANTLISYVEYLKKTFWPHNLAVYYPHPGSGISFAEAIVCLAVLCALSLWAVRSYPRRPYITVGWFWYLGTLVPVIGFVQVGSQAMADRYTYMPLNGIFIVMVWSFVEFFRHRKISTLSTGLVLTVLFSALIVGTRVQVSYWQNTFSLFKQAAKSVPENFLAHYKLGKILMNRGQSEEGLDHLRKAVDLAPRTNRFLFEFGNALLSTKKYEEAEKVYKKISHESSLKWKARLNRALVLTRLRRFAEAETEFKSAIKLNPNSAKIYNNRGLMKLDQGFLDQAEVQFRKALEIDNKMAAAQNNIAVVLVAKKKYSEAIRSYRKAILLNPASGKTHFNLANVLALKGKFAEAEKHYLQALKTERDKLGIHHNLGTALVQQGRKMEAAKHFKSVLKQDPKFEPSRRALMELEDYQ